MRVPWPTAVASVRLAQVVGLGAAGWSGVVAVVVVEHHLVGAEELHVLVRSAAGVGGAVVLH